MQENITYRRNIKKYLFVDLYNVPCTMHHQGYWENINHTKYKEIKFKMFLKMEDNAKNIIIRS